MPKKPSVNELQAQIEDLTEALKRERADVINIRRRHDDQISSLKSHITADLIKKLLPTVDNFNRALSHTPKDLENNEFIKGVNQIVKQFEKDLASIGVMRIKTIGEPFDPSLHEAISMEDAGGEQEIVSEELQPGYKLGDEVIRHAMVKVIRK